MNAIELLKQQHREVEALFDLLGVPEVAGTHGGGSHPAAASARRVAEGRMRDEGGGSAPAEAASESGPPQRPRDGSKPPSVAPHLTQGTVGGDASPALPENRDAAIHSPLGASQGEVGGQPQTAALEAAAGQVEFVENGAAVPTELDEIEDTVIERLHGDEKRRMFERLAQILSAHSIIEEQVFYPAVRSDRTDDLLSEAIEDHHAMRRMLDELRRTGVDEPVFDTRLEVLRETVDNHVLDEEGDLFPNVEDQLGQERLVELGQQMQEKFRTLRGYERSFFVAGEQPGQPTPATLRMQDLPVKGKGKDDPRRDR